MVDLFYWFIAVDLILSIKNKKPLLFVGFNVSGRFVILKIDMGGEQVSNLAKDESTKNSNPFFKIQFI